MHKSDIENKTSQVREVHTKTLDSAWTLSKKFGHMVNKGVNGMPKKLDLRGYTFHGCVVY